MMATWNFLWCLSWLFVADSVRYGDFLSNKLGRTVISTPQGRIRGLEVEFLDSTDLGKVEVFRGIEYHVTSASLRFMPPVGSYKIWDHISNLVEFRPPCSQMYPHPAQKESLPEFLGERFNLLYKHYLKTLKEECLSLNVYVPMKGKIYHNLSFH